MRGSRFALLGLAVLLALAAAAAVAPPLLNWNRYRDNFASLASAVLGRPVRIEGAVSLDLLPYPQFSAGRISIADGGDGIAISAQQLRLLVSLRALLTGHLEPLELVLQQPQIALPWPFNPAALTHRPDWLSGLSARIENARIRLGSLEFTNVDGSFAPDRPDRSAASLAARLTEPLTDAEVGGLVAHARGQFMGRMWRVTARLAAPAPPAGPPAPGASPPGVPAQLVLDGEGPLADTGASFAGQIAPDGSIAGSVTGRGADLSQLVPAPAAAWRAQGRVSIADGLAVADDLAVQLAGAAGRAAVALRLSPAPRLDLALAANRIDLDDWIAALRPVKPPNPRPGGAPPPSLLTGVDLSADAAAFHGGVLRQLRIAADLRPAEVTLREASATLPGDARITLAGDLSAASELAFAGHLQAAAPDLRATLAWLQQLGLVPAIPWPDGTARALTLSAGVGLAGGRLSLSHLDGSFDRSRLAGAAAWQLGPRPALAAHLSLDQLALDPLIDALPTTPAALQRQLAALAAAPIDADVRLEVAQATWQPAAGPLAVDHLILDAALQAGVLTVRSLQGAAEGLQAALSGQLTAAGEIGGAQLLLIGADATPLRRWLPERWQGPASIWHGPLDLKLTADGPPAALDTRIRLMLGDARLDASPRLNLPGRTATGPITLRHPGAPRLLRLLGVPDTEAWLGDGSLSLIAQLAAAPAGIVLEPLELIAADLHLHGRLGMVPQAEPAWSGRLVFDTLPIPLPAMPRPLPFDLLSGWRADLALTAAHVQSAAGELLTDMSAHVTLGDGVLRLDDLAGHLAGGQLAGTLRIDSRPAPPIVSVQAALHGATFDAPLLDLPIDLGRGVLDGQGAVQAAGYSPAGWLATLTGGAQASLHDGTLLGIDAAAAGDALDRADPAAVVDAARQALAGGATAFDAMQLDLKASSGLIDATARLQAPRTDADLAGSFDLAGQRLDVTVRVHPPQANAPVLTARLTGGDHAPTRTIDLQALAPWLETRP